VTRHPAREPAHPFTDPTDWRDELDDLRRMLAEDGRSGPLRDEVATLLVEVDDYADVAADRDAAMIGIRRLNQKCNDAKDAERKKIGNALGERQSFHVKEAAAAYSRGDYVSAPAHTMLANALAMTWQIVQDTQ
jgi:hypothetical protein